MKRAKTKEDKAIDAACTKRGLKAIGASVEMRRKTGLVASRRLGLTQGGMLGLGLTEWS